MLHFPLSGRSPTDDYVFVTRTSHRGKGGKDG